MTSETRTSSIPPIEIVIPTRNRPEDLRRLLPSLQAQTHRDFRVYIVDQSDRTGENEAAVSELADPRFVYVPTESRGKSKALNLALQQTTAQVIGFTDDDCVVHDHWLASGLSAMCSDKAAALVFGSLVAAEMNETQFFIPSIVFTERRVFEGPILRSYGLIGMGANMFVDRAVFEELGLFDEDLSTGSALRSGEECELAYRVLQDGRAVVQDNAVMVTHHGARPIAGGVARDLVNVGFYAIGAGLGKHCRLGHWRAFSVTLHETWVILYSIGKALLKRQKPFHIRRLYVFYSGWAAGLRAGPRIPRLAARG